ncbi:exosporium leader peptide-containing protein (plasmid) [Bacillus mycoides]|uniref:exosporium leader peptide-containing protein n=1 Tax=Bacillus mycoides TaxID=1405 RepID=UPI003F74D14B
MSEKNEFDSHEILNGSAFDPNLIGPTLPPIPPFTLPTGPTGTTGEAVPTGPALNINFRAEKDTTQTYTAPSTVQVSYGDVVFNNGGGLNDGKSTITFHTISSNMRCDIVSSFVRQAYQAVDEGCEMMTKEQRDEYEQKKIIAMIRDLRAKGVHNSADKVEETYKYITLAK